jgi:hypothetical protein
MGTDAFEVLDQMPSGVVLQAGMGRGTAAATLIEGDNAVKVRIEITPALRVASRTRSAVNEDDRQAIRRAAFIDIQHMRLFHCQIVPGVRFDLRVQSLHRCSKSPIQGLRSICRGAS